MKIVDEKKKREIEKVCAESEELKELQAKIKSAYLNKERSAQIAETQYRTQHDLVSYNLFSPNFLYFSKRTLKSRWKCSAERSSPIRPLETMLKRSRNNSMT